MGRDDAEQYEGEIIETEPGKDTGITDSILSTNITSIFWAIKTIRAQGLFEFAFSFPDGVIVKGDSQVAVSITELNGAGDPHMGDASMGILNVVPTDVGTIFVRGHIDPAPVLRCRLNFIIVN